MAISLLLVSPHKEFGEELRAKCQRNGVGDLRITDDFAEAIKITRQRKCPLALLDSDMEQQGISIVDIGYALRQINAAIYLIVIESERGGGPPGAGMLVPQATLPASFEFAAFQAIVGEILPDSRSSANTKTTPRQRALAQSPIEAQAEAPTAGTSDEYPWLNDVNRAAQHLTRMTLQSAAQAALITRDHELWAYAGQLPKPAAQELADSIESHWDRDEKTDLLRFVRLAATNEEYMLYATRLTADMILALVFDSETRFSTIRSQAGRLASSLATTPQDPDPGAGGNQQSADVDDLVDLPHLSTVLSDVPVPDPEPRNTAPDSQTETISAPDAANQGQATPVREEHLAGLFAAPVFSVESSPSVPLSRPGDPEYELAADNLAVDVDPDQGGPKQEQQNQDASQLAETRKTPVSEPGDARANAATGPRRIVLEPASPAVYNLDYACLLIPRFEQHYLTGDLTDKLAEWMQQICVAFGWRLEYISVRPEYLQWIASIPPNSSPGYLMRIVRQQTSDHIFVEFPRFHKENPSGDFWAPGYVIIGGAQPQPQKLIKDFIKQIRQRQGLIRPR